MDYRDHYETRPSNPYEDTGNTSFVGPIVALGVIALLIGGVFFFSGGSGEVDVTTETTAPLTTGSIPDTGQTAPAVPAEEPAAPQPAAPAAAQ